MPPGDYLSSYIAAMEAAGGTADESEIEQLRAQYGLDDPFLVRYVNWLGRLSPIGWAQGEEVRVSAISWVGHPVLKWPDMGMSFEYQEPVTSLIGERPGNGRCHRAAEPVRDGGLVRVRRPLRARQPAHGSCQRAAAAHQVRLGAGRSPTAVEVTRGSVPDPFAKVPGCAFHARCPEAVAGTCDQGGPPALCEVRPGHASACLIRQKEHGDA
ncbi:hypothetical protein ACERK3_07550 [Phycisphaerales bacterium AB-hyl4]|uniref:Oligopeptide/dipeptide ABC transporter C-terminal domain-containing protein n=1 Tax=Natronomicrosphaera hydrolytica TaxID=3242702 RepID=A0ABV4U4R2_9BACT